MNKNFNEMECLSVVDRPYVEKYKPDDYVLIAECYNLYKNCDTVYRYIEADIPRDDVRVLVRAYREIRKYVGLVIESQNDFSKEIYKILDDFHEHQEWEKTIKKFSYIHPLFIIAIIIPEIKIEFGVVVETIKPHIKNNTDLILPPSKIDYDKKKFVITSVLSNTNINIKFWDSLNTFAKHNDAQIVVIPIKYLNPTRKVNENLRYPQEVMEYLCVNGAKLPNNVIINNIPISATKKKPLASLEILSQGNDCIFGHSMVSLEVVPAPLNKHPNIMVTTGSCSENDGETYSNSVTGFTAGAVHKLGAVIVEICDGVSHIRHVESVDNGTSFYDLNKKYTHSGVVKTINNGNTFVAGDIHGVKFDPKLQDKVFGSGKFLKNIAVKDVVLHDVHDQYSDTHHDTIESKFAKSFAGTDCLQTELDRSCEVLNEIASSKGIENVYIASGNHGKHLDTFLNRYNPMNVDANFNNKLVYHKLWVDRYEAISNNEDHVDAFHLYFDKHNKNKKKIKNKVKFLSPKIEFRINGVVVHNHGDIGINGARSSLGYNKLGIPMVVGHQHTPSVKPQGLTICGYFGKIGENMPSYVQGGYSGWMQSGCLIYPDGSRTLLTFKNYECTQMV